MNVPRQAEPVERRAPSSRHASASRTVAPSNFQCWTERDCGGLAFQYSDTAAGCCGLGAKSSKGINQDQGAGCANCP
ncbi:MAG: hypothetical protein ACJ75H_14220 [Thermoanaerobaculia bacterium]